MKGKKKHSTARLLFQMIWDWNNVYSSNSTIENTMNLYRLEKGLVLDQLERYRNTLNSWDADFVQTGNLSCLWNAIFTGNLGMMHIGYQAKHRLVTVSFASTGLAMIIQRKIATSRNQFPQSLIPRDRHWSQELPSTLRYAKGWAAIHLLDLLSCNTFHWNGTAHATNPVEPI